MEFPFDINAVLPQEITILNGDFRVLNHGQTARISYVLDSSCFKFKFSLIYFRASDRLTTIIDTLGEASYKVKNFDFIRRNVLMQPYLGTRFTLSSYNCAEISYI